MNTTYAETVPFRIATASDGHKALMVEFPSVADMVSARDAAGPSRDKRASDWMRKWAGDFRKEVATGRGDALIADRIARGTARVAATATMLPAWEMAPAGAYPIVPAAIGGDPFSMRSRTLTASEQAPIKVWLPLTCSASVSSEEFAELLAEVQAAMVSISQCRPVELVGYTSLDCYLHGRTSAFVMTCPIPSAFEDYRALAVWCDASIGRNVAMAIVYAFDVGFAGKWGWRAGPQEPATIARMRECLGADEMDVFIPPVFGGSRETSNLRKLLSEAAARSGVELTF